MQRSWNTQSRPIDEPYLIKMSEDEDLGDLFLDDEDEENLEALMRDFRVPAWPR